MDYAAWSQGQCSPRHRAARQPRYGNLGTRPINERHHRHKGRRFRATRCDPPTPTPRPLDQVRQHHQCQSDTNAGDTLARLDRPLRSRRISRRGPLAAGCKSAVSAWKAEKQGRSRAKPACRTCRWAPPTARRPGLRRAWRPTPLALTPAAFGPVLHTTFSAYSRPCAAAIPPCQRSASAPTRTSLGIRAQALPPRA